MKYVVITGVSTGIGLAATKQLVDNGYFVFGSVRKTSDAERLTTSFPERFEALEFDVRNDEQIRQAAARVQAIIGPHTLSALVNNAGLVVPGPLRYLSADDLQKQLDVNVLGVFRVTNAFLPLLGAALPPTQKAGKIINISSVSGLFTTPFNGPYCISKHALESMNDAYRRELMLYGIDVVAIQPGPIKTPIWTKAIGLSERFSDSDYGSILKRADDIIRNTEKDALPVDRVSRLIQNVIESKKPRSRYLVHKKKYLFQLFARFVPDRIADRLIRKNLFQGNKVRPV